MSDDEIERRRLKVVENAVSALAEHFDSVQVFTTKHDPDGTAKFDAGSGNYFARYGQVREWLVKLDALTANEATAVNDDD